MEKSQYKLCLEVLRRLNDANVLKELILIGSWCIPFYKEYFNDVNYSLSIRTRDIDFLVSAPKKIKINRNVPKLLKDLGFVVSFKGEKGYIKLEHPGLIVEFLVPERGKGIGKPFPLPELGVNATTLRFLDLLSKNTIKIKFENFNITLPHPANFALHKLIVFQRRLREEKSIKDRDAAVEILKVLIRKGETKIIKNVYNNLLRKWQTKIINGLKKAKEKEILNILADGKSDTR